MATIVLGILRYTHGNLEWIGISWALGLAGAVAAFAGIALGRRILAAPGALLVTALCVVDGGRDLMGGGSRWIALWVDVLPAMVPSACFTAWPSAIPTSSVVW